MTSKSKNTGAGIHKTKLDYNDPMLLLEVEGFARDGYDDVQIAELLGVNKITFSRNKTRKRPDGSLSQLSQALKRGRAPLCVLVENALLKLAMGFTIKTTIRKTVSLELNENGQRCRVETIETETELPPGLKAITLWLKCHKPEVYNVRPEKADLTSKDKKLNSVPPRIAKIEHIYLDSIPPNDDRSHVRPRAYA